VAPAVVAVALLAACKAPPGATIQVGAVSAPATLCGGDAGDGGYRVTDDLQSTSRFHVILSAHRLGWPTVVAPGDESFVLFTRPKGYFEHEVCGPGTVQLSRTADGGLDVDAFAVCPSGPTRVEGQARECGTVTVLIE
jgi:hypothetical protein